MNRAYPHTRRQAPARTRFFALAFAAVLVGCGGRATDGGGASGQGKEAGRGDGMVAAAKVASCAGYTTEVAAQVLNVPAAEIEEKSQDLYEKLRSCSFVSSQDATRRVEFSLRRDDSVEEATDEMDVFRSHLGTGQGAMADVTGEKAKGAPYEEVPGLGDEALWAPINGTLNVRLGNVSVQVSLPDDREAQRRIAERVIAGLR